MSPSVFFYYFFAIRKKNPFFFQFLGEVSIDEDAEDSFKRVVFLLQISLEFLWNFYNDDHAYSCPRGWHLSASWGQIKAPPLKFLETSPQYRTEGFQGTPLGPKSRASRTTAEEYVPVWGATFY